MSPLCRVGQHESFFLLPLARQKPFGRSSRLSTFRLMQRGRRNNIDRNVRGPNSKAICRDRTSTAPFIEA
jgi:hypothetical protein